MNTESQRKAIAAHLANGGSLTAIEALQLFQCFRLASRMHEIARDMEIKKEWVTLANGKRVIRYSQD
jgi:hypothetical protein